MGEKLPLEFSSDLKDVKNLKSLSIGGRFTARMIRDASSIFYNLNELSLGRVSDTTLRALLDVYGGEDICLQSLSLSARFRLIDVNYDSQFFTTMQKVEKV